MCECGICNKCAGGKWIVLGLLILLNEMVHALSWGVFFGVLIILGGLMKFIKPRCGHVPETKETKLKSKR